MNSRRSIYRLALVTVVLLIAVDFHDAQARGGRGGGFSRGGPAAGGGFSSRGGAESRSGARGQRQQKASPQSSESRESRQTQHQSNQQNRQTQYDGNQETRQDNYDDVREDRQDFYEDEIDDDWDGCCDGDLDEGEALLVGAVVVGAAAVGASESSTDTYVQTTTTAALPCTPTVRAVEGVTYYNCGSTWYNQAYSGGGVTYITVQPPPGH